jgi:5-methylcytosine-specific restriction endonuclease McrA
MTGENNPNWKGGFAPYYGPNWDRQRRKALKRADYRCEYCGKTSAENGREVAIHHMKPLRTFGYIPGENENYLAANHLDNLIALCDVCHGRAEHGSISVSR